MTKREYAAVAAMQGYLATWGESAVHEFDVASKAVKCADALLANLGPDYTALANGRISNIYRRKRKGWENE